MTESQGWENGGGGDDDAGADDALQHGRSDYILPHSCCSCCNEDVEVEIFSCERKADFTGEA